MHRERTRRRALTHAFASKGLARAIVVKLLCLIFFQNGRDMMAITKGDSLLFTGRVY